MAPLRDVFAELPDQQALVTGASTGIGRAIALELARAGADVIIHCAKSIDRAQAVAAEIRLLDRRADVAPADLREMDHAAYVDDVWTRSGGLDVWVNNAGVDLLTGPEATGEYGEKLRQLLTVDVTGTALLSREVASRMRERGAGVILNIGWDQADRGMEGESAELFSTAKNAIMGLTRSLAVSFAPEVRVNCIAPGWIQTEWGQTAGPDWQQRVIRETPLRRWGQPDDIAKLARFLVSREAAYITGQVINANGGAVR